MFRPYTATIKNMVPSVGIWIYSRGVNRLSGEANHLNSSLVLKLRIRAVTPSHLHSISGRGASFSNYTILPLPVPYANYTNHARADGLHLR